MDAGILNTFIEATLDVTRNMAQLDADVGKPGLKKGVVSDGHVTGFIELRGPDHLGTLAISFDEIALLLVYQRMLGEELTKVDESALDLAGEIANMVCGGAKKRLADIGYDFDLTRPSILSGLNHEIAHTAGGPVTVLPLGLGNGKMFIEVCMDR